MDFFQHQDAARRKTWLLSAYFGMAVVLMVVCLYAVVVAALDLSIHQLQPERAALPSAPIPWWRPDILAGVLVVTLGIIGLGSLYKTFELRQGGRVVAELLGGRPVGLQTKDLAERQLLNVVEEMALASGVPVPPVYVLADEEGINAFAAGYAPSDAVIGVNRGTLDFLSRDELQGVISHEFSHILNGDMRLNLRLIGLLHGILLIALVGYYLLRIGAGSGRSSSGKKGGGSQLVLIALGALVIGSVGLFFGRLIKASVSRQREYLADASAVQFTRNPDGIAGALKKIGGLAAGSRMQSPAAETASHMFFGSAFRSLWFHPFATHPPLGIRIKRIDPRFDGQFPRTRPLAPQPATPARPAETPPEPAAARMGPGALIPVNPVLVLAAIGMPAAEHAQYAAHLLASLPALLAEAMHEPCSARAVIFAMLLAADPSTRASQRRLLQEREGKPTQQESEKLAPLLADQGRECLLPIVEVVQGTLRDLSDEQYDRFRATVEHLVAADRKVSLFEFFLKRVLLGHLDRVFRGHRPPPVRFHALRGVRREAASVLSLMAHAGHHDAAGAQHAFTQAIAVLKIDEPPGMLSRNDCSLAEIDRALTTLAAGTPAIKKRILGAAVVAVAADGNVTVPEAELLRVVADALDCPMPPLVLGPVPRGD